MKTLYHRLERVLGILGLLSVPVLFLKLLKLRLKKIPVSWKKTIEKIHSEESLEKIFEKILLAENQQEIDLILQEIKEN
jgi:hypothetical protein